jgi:CubicO group peptidase (beta-lactamase class C family)
VIYGFDSAGFLQELQTNLVGNVAGFSVGLNQHGSTIEQATWGWAKWPLDGAEGEPWTLDTRMNVASLNKIVTAIAMMKVLGAAGLSPDTPIIGYLPAYWAKGPNVDKITFADLLAHTSGLAYNNPNASMDFAGMKEAIEAGTLNWGDYSYENVNYGLCRVLLATVNGSVPPTTIVCPVASGDRANVNDNLWNTSTINLYASYVAEEIFAPSGVHGPGFAHDPADALAYDFPVTSGSDADGALDQQQDAAFHMSVNEMLRVMGTFRRAGTLVSPTQAQVMLDRGFGLNRFPPPPFVSTSVLTNLGYMYYKLGGWAYELYEEQCVAFFLPQDMELVVMVNSPLRDEEVSDGTPRGNLLYPLVELAFEVNIVEMAGNAPAPPA